MFDTNGEYENEIRASKDVLSIETCKRILSAMHYGCLISYANGHRWIYCFDIDENDKSLNEELADVGMPPIREKCYGSVLDALDRIDGALKVLGYSSLLKTYDQYPEGWK